MSEENGTVKHFRIADDLWKALEAIAKQERRSRSSQVIYILEQAVKQHKEECDCDREHTEFVTKG